MVNKVLMNGINNENLIPSRTNRVIVTNTVTKSSTSMRLDEERTRITEEKIFTTYSIASYKNSETGRIIEEISRKKLGETKTVQKRYELKEIAAEELKDLRESGTPGIVIKEDGRYFYAEIDFETKFYNNTLIGQHLCSECHRCSAAPDELSGCEKVRNYARNIENYDWITEGFESFNTENDCFVVTKCEHFIPMKKEERKTHIETAARRARLDRMEEIKRRHEKNQKILAELKERKAMNRIHH